MMHAGPKLLEALIAILPYAENELESLRDCHRRDGGLEAEIASCEAKIESVVLAIAEATDDSIGRVA